MTDDEADRLVDELVAAWPGTPWSDQAMHIYAVELERLHYEPARRAVRAALRTLRRPPVVAELLALYRAEHAAMATLERTIVAPADGRLPPDTIAAGQRGVAMARAQLRERGGPSFRV